MKTKSIAICIAVTAASVSCAKHGPAEVSGTVSFSVAENFLVADAVKSNVSDYTALPSVADFKLKVTNADGTSIYEGLLSGWDVEQVLPGGGYTAEVSYGAEGEEGFDKPYFAGSTDFSVVGATTVSVSAALANTIVKMSYSKAFTDYFSDYTMTVKTGNNFEISFPKDETRGAFVDAYKFTLSGTMTGQGGSVKTFSREFTDLEPQTCYTIAMDVANTGSNTITITFNDTVEVVELSDLELNE